MPDPVRPSCPSELDQLPDRDPQETGEWRESLDAVAAHAGDERAAYLVRRTVEHARNSGLAVPALLETEYVNTIPTSAEPAFPGDEALESRITAWNRWNAAAMVTRGSRQGLGGHIATFASAAWLYETGFQHFFRGKEGEDGSGDQLYVQGHASPGVYARAFLDGRLTEGHLDRFRQEAGGAGLPQGHASPGVYARAFLDGRLTEGHLDRFRQEAGGAGLPSYPHPRRLPWL
ncbi:hypothetical protein AN219_02280, partial [Streptomyces nanshensis]